MESTDYSNFYHLFGVDDYFFANENVILCGGVLQNPFNIRDPKNLYKYILFEADQFVQMKFGLPDPEKDCSKPLEAGKLLYQKNYRVLGGWSDYAKKKVNAAHSMIHLLEIIHQLDKEDLTVKEIDFRKVRDLFKACIDDDTFFIIRIICYMYSCVLKEVNCFKIAKIFMLLTETNFKIASELPLFEKYVNIMFNTHQQNREDVLLSQKVSAIQNKLQILKTMFLVSIDCLTGCNDQEAQEYEAFDEENAEILMECLKDVSQQIDLEFFNLPGKIKNKKDAEMVVKLIIKLSNELYELSLKDNINKIQEFVDSCNIMDPPQRPDQPTKYGPSISIKNAKMLKEFYAGFVFCVTAYFQPDEDIKYETLTKGVDALEKLLASSQIEKKEIREDVHELLSDAYGVLWNIKFNLHKAGPSKIGFTLVKSLAEKRISNGHTFIDGISCTDSYDKEIKKLSTMLDIVKCQVQVFCEEEKGKAIAAKIVEILLENPEKIDKFKIISGVHVCEYLTKDVNIGNIISKCK